MLSSYCRIIQGVNPANAVAFAERAELLGVEGLLAPRALLGGQLARGELEDAFDFAPPLD
jgi:hypothetical protein